MSVSLFRLLQIEVKEGAPFERKRSYGFHPILMKWCAGVVAEGDFSASLKAAISVLDEKVRDFHIHRSGDGFIDYTYSRKDIDDLIRLLNKVFHEAGGREDEFLPIDEDSPIPFTGENFVRSIEANAEILRTTDYIVTLMPRIKTLLTDVRVKKVIDNNTPQIK